MQDDNANSAEPATEEGVITVANAAGDAAAGAVGAAAAADDEDSNSADAANDVSVSSINHIMVNCSHCGHKLSALVLCAMLDACVWPLLILNIYIFYCTISLTCVLVV